MSPLFDPERAAIFHARRNDFDEAVWISFLATHFGKNLRHGWHRLRDVYSGLGSGTWTWQRVSSNPTAFRDWLRTHQHQIGGGWGNHRKYESLKADGKAGTGSAVVGYVDWIGPTHSHAKRFSQIVQGAGNDPHTIFDAFYKAMKVPRFARLGKFDFLALLGRLGLAPIEPGKAYLKGASGPLTGARLLFEGQTPAKKSPDVLDGYVQELGLHLGLGMQVMEDAICNWQKSPDKFVHFRG